MSPGQRASVAVPVEVGREETGPGQRKRRLEETLQAGVRPERTLPGRVIPLRATLLHDVVQDRTGVAG